jgi:hypothetical protein
LIAEVTDLPSRRHLATGAAVQVKITNVPDRDMAAAYVDLVTNFVTSPAATGLVRRYRVITGQPLTGVQVASVHVTQPEAGPKAANSITLDDHNGIVISWEVSPTKDFVDIQVEVGVLSPLHW